MFRIGNARRASGERGAVLVETAILIPVVLMITFGLIEFSSAYQSSSTATAASRSAARTASAEALLPTYATDAAAAAATALKHGTRRRAGRDVDLPRQLPTGYPGRTV